ncbi:MAG: hypothetical protein Q8861_02210 [Bacteroidota bacterium]|nr:hypothetical protein [Bacteroidota bacterium]
MKKTLKILGIIVFFLLILVASVYSYLTNFGRKILLSSEPRKPHFEIPITYNMGWWSNQKALTVDSLRIEIIESKLNLFSSKSLIAYVVRGHLNYRGYWQPFIKEIHISERINSDTTLNCDRIIEITPVIENIEKSKANQGSYPFEFRNEHTITSNHWGINHIRFICGQKKQTIELQQFK